MKRMDPRELSAWKNQTPGDVWDEVVRARSEERRLEEELMQKDETIQALADALKEHSVRILVLGEGVRLPSEVEGLLRNLGRLP